MKRLLFFCLLIIFWMCYGYKEVDSECRKTLHKNSYDIIPLTELVQILAELEIDSTADFMDLKTEGLLPDGMPEWPLVYPALKGKWSNLWDRVNKKRLQEEKKKTVLFLITINPKITITKIADVTKLTLSTAQSVINQLKREGWLARIGSRKIGYWKILEKGEKPPEKDPKEEIKEQILALITENSKITIQEMAKATGLTPNTTSYIIDQMKSEKQIAYVGLAQNGFWEKLKNGAASSPDPMEQRKKQILDLIAENSKITASEIENVTELTLHSVHYTIHQLKEEERLVRIGGANNGHWEIPEDGTEPSSDPMLQRITQILDLIAENSKITKAEIADILNLTRGEMGAAIRRLKREGLLEYIGNAPWGYWKILEKEFKQLIPQEAL